ncbi:MAG TPA: 23S rRNA (adenine(2503)-C(2))-methyltransferase RlmN [Sedimentisphaerales bacterium]
MEKDLKSQTLAGLERLVVGLDQPKYLAEYIFSAIQARRRKVSLAGGVNDISAITTLSKSFRAKLVEEGYYISKLEIVDKLTDPDGTVKYVFGLSDGGRIESVLLFDDDRRTLCVSTQVGCAMGCVFCATGRLGLARNLTAGEIVDQVNVIADCGLQIADCNDSADSSPAGRRPVEMDSKIRNRISNVVFMGMGEPLANYDAVLDAVRILNNSAGRHIGIRHLTMSTCGLVEGIERLADEDIQPRLAISLNAPTDAIRQKLMPITKKYLLDRLFAAIGRYQRTTRNRVTFEYCLIKGVNDTVLHAQMLVKRLRGVMCNVNLIEYNTHEGCNLKPSGRQAIERFAGVLKDAGIETTIRLKMGQTINAACGQLGSKRTEKSE